jgi:iron(III) transport system permease protein
MVFDNFKGLANKLIELLPFVEKGPFDIFSWWGIIWVHLVTATLPIKVMLLTPAFRNMDATLEEASRTSGAGPLGTLARVGLPLMAPTILVVTILGIIRSMEAFEIELILGYPAKIEVYSTLIYRLAHKSPPEYGQATILAMVVLTSVLPLILFQQWYTSRRTFTTMTGKFKSQPLSLGRWRWPAFAIVFALVLTMTVLPVGLVLAGTFMSIFGFFFVPDAWTLRNWQAVLNNGNFINALVNSVIIAGGTATFAMVSFTTIAYVIVRTKFSTRGLLDFLVWLPSTLPGVIIGLGYLWMFLGTPLLRPIYGTTLILIIVAALGSITLTTQLIKGSLLQHGADLEEASRASGASWFQTFRHVILPLIAPAMAVVGVLAFSAAARATSHVALLSTHANQPLSMLQLNLMADNNYEAASVVGVFILLLTVGVALVARALGLRMGPASSP